MANVPLALGADLDPTHGMVNAGHADAHDEFSYLGGLLLAAPR